MDDLRDLYQATILDHNKKPRNFRALADASHRAEGYNPLCGDQLTVYLDLEGERVRDASFEGQGCAISTASASLMTEYVRGRSLVEIRETFERFHALVTGSPVGVAPAPELGKLAVFASVCEYPMRVKCATLSWHALRQALDGESGTATTE